jgi:hypothetical protein
MNNILKYCQNAKYCSNMKPSKKKLVTAGNDPKITKSMRYSQYISTTKGTYKQMLPIDYVNQTNLFIEQYILQNNAHININLDNFNIFVQQYELKKNTIDNITLEEYNSLVIDLNIWIQEYKDNNGKTINITVFDSFLNSLNLYLQQYSQQNNIVINLDDLNIESITTNFINGKIAVEVYFNYLSRIFINSNNDYLNNLLLGIYPLIPVDKAFYLKNYANKINSYGSVWNHYNKNRPTSNNFNFLKYF